MHLPVCNWRNSIFFNVVSRRRRYSKAACLKPWMHLLSLTIGGIILGLMPCGRRRYNSSLIREQKAIVISIPDKRRDSEAARLKRTLILLLDAASANVSKNVELSWLLPAVHYICGYYHQHLI